MKDYEDDNMGSACLELVESLEGPVGFGAAVYKEDKIIGSGVARKLKASEKGVAPCTENGYLCAVSSALLSAETEQSGTDISGSEVYVLGKVLRGDFKGSLLINPHGELDCKACVRRLEYKEAALCVARRDKWDSIHHERVEGAYVKNMDKHIMFNGRVVSVSSVWNVGDLDIYFERFTEDPKGRFFVTVKTESNSLVRFHVKKSACVCRDESNCEHLSNAVGRNIIAHLNLSSDYAFISLFEDRGEDDVVWHKCAKYNIL